MNLEGIDHERGREKNVDTAGKGRKIDIRTRNHVVHAKCHAVL